MEQDAVDRILEQWQRERPDLDVTSMGVMGRLTRASRLASLDLQEFMSQFGLEPGSLMSWQPCGDLLPRGP